MSQLVKETDDVVRQWAIDDARADRISKAMEMGIALTLAAAFAIVICWFFPRMIHLFL